MLRGGVIGQAGSWERWELAGSELSYLEGTGQMYPVVSQPAVCC